MVGWSFIPFIAIWRDLACIAASISLYVVEKEGAWTMQHGSLLQDQTVGNFKIIYLFRKRIQSLLILIRNGSTSTYRTYYRVDKTKNETPVCL